MWRLCLLSTAVITLTACIDAGSLPSSEPASSTAKSSEPARDANEILGVSLGTKAIPECSKEYWRDSVFYTIPPKSYPCWGESNIKLKIDSSPKLPTTPTETFEAIRFNPETIPAGVSDRAHALIINGSVEELSFMTNGASYQQSIYNLLEKKFGSPTSKEVENLQNAMGAKYENIYALWRFPSMTVSFSGMGSNPASGRITASTTKAKSYWNRELPKRGDSF